MKLSSLVLFLAVLPAAVFSGTSHSAPTSAQTPPRFTAPSDTRLILADVIAADLASAGYALTPAGAVANQTRSTAPGSGLTGSSTPTARLIAADLAAAGYVQAFGASPATFLPAGPSPIDRTELPAAHTASSLHSDLVSAGYAQPADIPSTTLSMSQ